MTTTTTRRTLLRGAATLPALALATVPALAEIIPAADPIFTVLEAFRRADVDFFARREGNIPPEACEQWWDAKCVVIRTLPTTPAGLAALTGFARALSARSDVGCLPWKVAEVCALTATIDDATRGMAGLAPWSPPAAVTGNDPIFVAIEAHRAAVQEEEARHAEHRPIYDMIVAPATQDELTAALENPIFRASADKWQAAGDVELEAATALASTAPTTIAGIAVAMAYLAEWMADHDPGSGIGDDDTMLEDGLFSILFAQTIADATAFLDREGT